VRAHELSRLRDAPARLTLAESAVANRWTSRQIKDAAEATVCATRSTVAWRSSTDARRHSHTPHDPIQADQG